MAKLINRWKSNITAFLNYTPAEKFRALYLPVALSALTGWMLYSAYSLLTLSNKRIDQIVRHLDERAMVIHLDTVFRPTPTVSANYKDVNGDGRYEAVLQFINPNTGKLEERLMEMHGDAIKIREFTVKDGKIHYHD